MPMAHGLDPITGDSNLTLDGTEVLWFDKLVDGEWLTFRCTFAELVSTVPALSIVTTETGANRDILTTDVSRYIRFDDASPQTATFLEDVTEALPDNFEVHIRCVDADLTLTPDGAVALNPPAGGTLVLEAGMTVTVKRVAVDEFDVIGQTVPL